MCTYSHNSCLFVCLFRNELLVKNVCTCMFKVCGELFHVCFAWRQLYKVKSCCKMASHTVVESLTKRTVLCICRVFSNDFCVDGALCIVHSSPEFALFFFVTAERLYQGLPLAGALQLHFIYCGSASSEGKRRQKEMKNRFFLHRQ